MVIILHISYAPEIQTKREASLLFQTVEHHVYYLVSITDLTLYSAESMKVVALVSGGKDSCYNMMECVRHGHEVSMVDSYCFLFKYTRST